MFYLKAMSPKKLLTISKSLFVSNRRKKIEQLYNLVVIKQFERSVVFYHLFCIDVLT